MSNKKKNRPPPSGSSVSPDASALPVKSIWQYIEWAALAWAGFIVFQYLLKNPLYGRVFESMMPTQFRLPTVEAWFFYLKGIIVWAGLMAGSLALGYIILGRLNISWHSALERFVLSLGAGYGFASLLMLGLAGARWAHSEVIFVLWLAGVIGFSAIFAKACEARDFLKNAAIQIRDFLFGSENPLLLRIFLWIFLALSFMMALVPDLFYDAAVYHLGAPNLYLAEHGLARIGGVLSKVPMIWQILWMYGLALVDEIVPKLTHWSCGLLIVLGMRALAGRFNAPRAGMAGGLFFLSVPMVQMNLWTAGVDIGGCLVAFLALYAALAIADGDSSGASAESSAASAFPAGWVAMAAIFSAFAFGSKYQGGMIGLLVFLLFIYYFLSRSEKKPADFVKAGLVFSLVSGALVLPWLLKNIWDTGNPLFPFLTPLFDKLGWQKYHIAPDQWTYFIGENRRFITQSWREWWKLPWMLTFKDSNISSLSFVGPLFLALAPLCLLAFQRVRERWVQAAFLFLAAFFIFSLGSTHLTRYHLPGYPMLCFVYGLAFALTWRPNNWPAKVVLGVGLSVMFLQSLQQGIFILQNSYAPWDVLSGRESREDYRSYTHSGLNPYPSNAMYRWMEKNLPPQSRVLLIGESKAFDFHRPHLYTDVHGENQLTTWVWSSNNAEEIYQKVKEAGVSHLFISFTEAHRTYGYKMIKWDERTLKIFDDFWKKYVRFTHQDKIPEKFTKQESALVLFEVLPEDEAARRGPPGTNILAILENMNKK